MNKQKSTHQPAVFDCTIRDGGIMNRWNFSHQNVRHIYQANAAAGVDYMEIGYKASTDYFSPAEYGRWRFCFEDDIRLVMEGLAKTTKLALMVDIGRCHRQDILPCEKSLIDAIRIAHYVHEIDEAVSMANYCVDQGYECFMNIMAVSREETRTVVSCLEKVEKHTQIRAIYLSDTFGSMGLDQVAQLSRLYRQICATKALGFHGHNNQQLALANSLLALANGAEFLDGSFYGMGRGAGNTPLELLLAQLDSSKYQVGPILDVIESDIEPLLPLFKWGYHIPYAVAGITNSHPQAAMKFVSENAVGYGEFFRQMAGELAAV